MAVYLSPVGLSTAQVPNRVSLLAIYKEDLCSRICENSTNQPETFVTYKTGTPIFNGTTVFVPVIATVTIVTPGCGCAATTQVITEKFEAAFQEQSSLPTSIVISTEGQTQELATARKNLTSGNLDTGLTYSNISGRNTVMVISLTSSPAEFLNSWLHEMRHLSRHIEQACAISPYGEEAAYLAGEIGQRMFPVAKRFICEHCRKELTYGKIHRHIDK